MHNYGSSRSLTLASSGPVGWVSLYSHSGRRCQLKSPPTHFLLLKIKNKGLHMALRVCLVGVKTRRMENKERKIGWKMAFSIVWLRRENKEIENRGKIFLSEPTFFYPPNLGGKWGGKSAERWTLHKYPQFKLHFFFLSSLFPGQHRCPFFFLGNNVASNVVPFFLLLFFSFFGQSCRQLLLFFLGH